MKSRHTCPGRLSLFRTSRTLIASFSWFVFASCASENYVELYPYESSVSVNFLKQAEVEKPMDVVPVNRNDRVNRLVGLFQQAGCRGENLRKEKVTGSMVPTVICRLQGKTDKTIVVSAHHVISTGGKGIFDAWTAVTLLPSLYASIARQEHEHSYEFVGFASTHTKGDASYEYLVRHPERQENVVAMIWLDFIGLGPLSAWSERTDPNLFADLVSAGKALSVPVGGLNLHGVDALREVQSLHDFSRAFRWFDIPTIYLHSLSEASAVILTDKNHDSRISEFDRQAYFESYRVLAVYLGYLDRSLEARKL